jgi:hypothetical protein
MLLEIAVADRSETDKILILIKPVSHFEKNFLFGDPTMSNPKHAAPEHAHAEHAAKADPKLTAGQIADQLDECARGIHGTMSEQDRDRITGQLATLAKQIREM